MKPPHPAHKYALLLAMILCQTIALQARILFVNNLTGDDEQDGSSADSAFHTLRKAVAVCRPGDTISLAPNTPPYRESLALGRRGGTPAAPLVIEGNGAVLSGLETLDPEGWSAQENGIWFFPSTMRRGSLRPFLVQEDGTPVPQKQTPDDLAPGEHAWTTEGIVFRPANGKSLHDYRLQGTLRAAGVALAGASYVHVRNLTCEFFANDGFNIHGSCMGLFFQNIEARWNGDDGFSVHEDVGASVQGGYFHHNTYGIQDVNASRSDYSGVLVEHNRLHGVHFSGGCHSLVDAIVQENGSDQVRIDGGTAAHLGMRPDNPLCSGTVFLRNVTTRGGKAGLRATGQTRLAVRHSHFHGAEVGVALEEQATAHLDAIAVSGCTTRSLEAESPHTCVTGAVLHPQRIRWQNRDYVTTEEVATLLEQTPALEQVLLSEPQLRSPEDVMLAGPTVLLGERQVLPGPTNEIDLPHRPRQAMMSAGAGELTADFESENPWCRVYPVPEGNAHGDPVVSESSLSQEQAASGESSMRLRVTLPPPEPTRWTIKLFSVKLESITTPVRRVRFDLFGSSETKDVQVRLRLRDRSGESFYGQRQNLDWIGWKTVDWILAEAPPTQVSGGDKNRQQDGPPLEVVLEIYAQTAPEGRTLTLYIDNLYLDMQRE